MSDFIIPDTDSASDFQASYTAASTPAPTVTEFAPHSRSQWRFKANLVASVEIINRLLLIIRTGYFCFTERPEFCWPGSDCHYFSTVPWYTSWYYAHEMIRIGPGMIVIIVVIALIISAPDDDDDYSSSSYRRRRRHRRRRYYGRSDINSTIDEKKDKDYTFWEALTLTWDNIGLWWFIIPYVIYSAGLIFLSGLLWKATSREGAASHDNCFKEAPVWRQVHFWMLIPEIVYDVVVLGLASRDFLIDGSGGRIFFAELFFSILAIAYRGFTLHIVRSFEKEVNEMNIRQNANRYMTGMMNPAISSNPVTVVRPEPYQSESSTSSLYPKDSSSQYGMEPYGYPQEQSQYGMDNYNNYPMQQQQYYGMGNYPMQQNWNSMPYY